MRSSVLAHWTLVGLFLAVSLIFKEVRPQLILSITLFVFRKYH